MILFPVKYWSYSSSFLKLAMILLVSLHVNFVTKVAWAEESVEERVQAQRLFQEGVAAAQERDYTSAIEKFTESYELFPHPGTLLNLGLYQLEVGRRADAYQTLGQLLDTHNAVISEDARREVIARIRELESVLATVPVDSVPQGAMIVIDGEEWARTPLDDPLILEPGSFVFQARLDGHETATITRNLQPGTNQLIELELAARAVAFPLPVLQVECGTEGAEITLDEGASSSPPLRIEIQPGPHEVRVEAPGYMTESRSVVVPEVGIVHLVVDLVPLDPLIRTTELLDSSAGSDASQPGSEGQGDGPMGERLRRRRRIWSWIIASVVLTGAATGVAVAVTSTRTEPVWTMRLP